MRLIALALLLSGCSAALVERLSSGAFDGPEKEPFVHEHPIGVDDPFGVAKRLIVANPLPYAIDAIVECSSMFQADQFVHVGAHRERYLLITAPSSYRQSCWLTGYSASVNQ